MLTPETRFIDWDLFRERVHALCSDVEDALTFTYAPYGKTPDKDTPFFEKLFDEFERLDERITKHSEKLYAQWCEWDEESHEIALDDELDDALSWIYLEGICGDGGDC